jgi:hypothetical protein
MYGFAGFETFTSNAVSSLFGQDRVKTHHSL